MLQLSSGSDSSLHQTFTLQDTSQIGEVRRAAATIGQGMGFDETVAGRISIIVTEAAGNIIKHGGGGSLILRAIGDGKICGLEILAIDKGSGMANPEMCFRDGYSTSGTPGTGLGAIRRLSSVQELFTRDKMGTVLLSRVFNQPSWMDIPPQLGLGAICTPFPGEHICGDAWALEQTENSITVFVADGLGHGEFAALASSTAVRIFRSNFQNNPVNVAQMIHEGLRSTRGAAIAVAKINLVTRKIHYVGVGNIVAAILSDNSRQHMVSHNGTAGAEARKIQEFVYPFPPKSLLLMHSDGIGTHWSLESYPGLSQRDPALIAGVIYRDFVRGRDDATMLAIREAKVDSQ